MSPILTFDNVGIAGRGPGADVRAEGVHFTLSSGEIVLVQADHDSEDIPFLELAIGLLAPDQGRICFEGQDWCTMGYPAQLAARSRIGTLARRQVWLANQTVLRNVLLGQRHHTLRSEEQLEAEADMLANRVGLAGIPRSRPEAVAARPLRMAGWVRAFMGHPVLLVLMFPGHEAVMGWPSMLDDLLQRALQAGAAALVVSDQERLVSLPVMLEARRFRIEAGTWKSG